MIRRFFLTLFLLDFAFISWAEDEILIGSDAAALVPNLQFLKPLMRKNEEFSEITPAPVLGLFQIAVGTQIFYLSSDGRYLLKGDMLDLAEGENISENHRKVLRNVGLKDIPLKDLIIFSPQEEDDDLEEKNNKKNPFVIIFSNLNCSYCRTVYEDIPKYLERGIEVRIAPFVHAPKNSNAYKKITEVWCSPDRKTALDRNYREQKTVPAFCDDEFLHNDYITALKLGISTVPSYVLEDGELLNGYIAPDSLIKILQHKEDKN